MVSYDGDKDSGLIEIIVEEGVYGGTVSQEIQFQHGPVQENGINGVQNEHVLALLLLRLRDLNSKFPCRENSIAITKIEEAKLWLDHRTALRQAQGVEGQNIAHVS